VLPYQWSAAEQAALDEVEFACFSISGRKSASPASLAKDRMKAPVASIAAVGFQLSALPIGVERGWITRDEGLQRAHMVLTSLLDRRDNRKFGVFLHYPDPNTRRSFARRLRNRRQHRRSTPFLLAGVITAGQ